MRSIIVVAACVSLGALCAVWAHRPNPIEASPSPTWAPFQARLAERKWRNQKIKIEIKIESNLRPQKGKETKGRDRTMWPDEINGASVSLSSPCLSLSLVWLVLTGNWPECC